MSPLLDLADVAPRERARAEDALDRFTLRAVRDPESPDFDAAWDLFATFFLDSGELEEREVLRGMVREPRLDYGEGRDGTYHLVTAWDGATLVGARDFYVDVDVGAGVCLVALSHTFVSPSCRRSGLAAVFRSLPATVARASLRARFGRDLPTLLAAEMEPVDPEVPDTVVRLVAYGRSGFKVADPRRLPYSQPEFRELEAPRHTALPLLPVVRPVGLPDDALAPELLRVFPDLFHVVHRRYLPEARVAPSHEHALRALARSPEPVPLLPLPVDGDSLHHLAPLVRGAVLPLYPEGLRGPHPDAGDPADELARVVAAWGRRA